ncbi:MAG: Rnf-Nqr domain containing protein, partial [Clostridia bacterium]
MQYLMIIFAAVFANNFILVQFLGICPFLGVSKKTDTALGMGLAVIFVMSLSSLFTFVVYKYILVLLHVEYLKTIAFILIIASLVQIVEMIIKKLSPSLYSALGVYLPLITTNCAVLGAALLGIDCKNILEAFLMGAFSGVGFTLAIVLLSGIR